MAQTSPSAPWLTRRETAGLTVMPQSYDLVQPQGCSQLNSQIYNIARRNGPFVRTLSQHGIYFLFKHSLLNLFVSEVMSAIGWDLITLNAPVKLMNPWHRLQIRDLKALERESTLDVLKWSRLQGRSAHTPWCKTLQSICFYGQKWENSNVGVWGVLHKTVVLRIKWKKGNIIVE